MHPSIHATTQPDKPACIMAGTGEVLTYGELDARANQLAHFFRDSDAHPGDTIAIVLENQPGLFVAVWAAQRAGLYFACLSYRLSGEDLSYILAESGTKLVIASSATRDLVDSAVA